jgi:hypothetical protein
LPCGRDLTKPFSFKQELSGSEQRYLDNYIKITSRLNLMFI